MNLFEFFVSLWRGRFIILASVFLIGIIGIIITSFLPNIYQASVLLAASSEDSSSKLSGLGSTLAAFAGTQSGDLQVSKADIVLGTLKSREFILDFVDRHEITTEIMAVKSWDKNSGEIKYDTSLFDPEKKIWLTNEGRRPADWKIYERFLKIMSVVTDLKTGFITISVNFPVPETAKKWVDWLVEDINQVIRDQDVREARKRVEYLLAQSKKTEVNEIKTVFSDLIKEDLRKALLAETKEEYFLKTIDPAVTPEKPVRPIRALFYILSILTGFMVGVIIIYSKWVWLSFREYLS